VVLLGAIFVRYAVAVQAAAVASVPAPPIACDCGDETVGVDEADDQ
jgi:hypothetical protein